MANSDEWRKTNISLKVVLVRDSICRVVVIGLSSDAGKPGSNPVEGSIVGRLAKATFITFFVYLCSTNVALVTKPNLDNNKQIILNHQLLLTCAVLSLEYYVSYRITYSGDHAD